MRLSLGGRATMLNGFVVPLDGGSFALYQTNTSLAVFPLADVAAAVGDSAAIVSAQTSSTGTEVAGTVNRFVITNDTSSAVLSGSVGAIGSGADIETPSLTITAALTQTLNALVLRMADDGVVSVEASLALQ